MPFDYYDEKERTNNGSNITGVLKHNTEKKVENKDSTGMRNKESTGVHFAKTRKTING